MLRVFWGPWTLENESIAWARCYFSEIHVFHAKFSFGSIFDRFVVALLGTGMMPKWIQTTIKKLIDFLIAPGRARVRQKNLQ